MFEKASESNFVGGEHEVLQFWADARIFEKLRAKNAEKPKWSFLDGPITANNPMGVHHAWGRTYKDAYQRFFAMTGHDQRYQNGFDCQGLWVEIEVEKELKLDTRESVEKLGLDEFVNSCKRRVLRFAARQTEQSIRLGFWMDWDDPDELRKLSKSLGSAEPVTITTPSQKQVTGPAHQLAARLGNPEWGGSYFTFSTENNDTIWTFLKKCFDRGKIYRGSDVMPWSGRAGSAYSQMEVADGRKLTVHRSLFVRFPLKDRENEYLLVWTTTPWTLTSNVAAAINLELNYVRLKSKRDGAVYYFAEDNLEFARLAREFKEGFGRPEWKWPSGTPKLKTIAQMFKEQGGYSVEGVIKGKEMLGWRYEGPFDGLEAQQMPGGYPAEFRVGGDAAAAGALSDDAPSAVGCHRVIDGGRDSKGSPTVVAGEGTGIVHIAPGCGDIDYKLGEKEDLVRIAPLGADGRFGQPFGDFAGKEAIAGDTTDLVIQQLRDRGFLVYVEKYPHIYPHCWRTGDELVFRLVDEWFINMDWREEIKQIVRQIEWLPESIDGQNREIEWLSNMGNWMISKKRFWGLAIPIWIEEYEVDGRAQVDFEVLGSLQELKERAVEGWNDFDGQTPHRPWIDGVKIRNPKTGNLMSRIPDVGNPWLDAGIVPFSTMHYNTDRAEWEKWYPADLVVECFPGQFRNWFYAMLSMAAMMDKSAPFKHLIGHRLVMNEDGKPMHKSDGTAIWFEEAAEQLGVDTMRWMFLAQAPAVDLRFGTRHPDQPVTIPTPCGPISQTVEGVPICKVESKPADDIRRRVLIPLWNCYAFFTNYARLDEFDPRAPRIPVEQRPEIDRWILSNLQVLIETCNREFRAFNVAEVCRATVAFIDDLSNWYIRRNRRRFWRSREEDDADKLAAYQTLYEVLVELTKLLAPCIPFLTERMYRNLTRVLADGTVPASVHLCDYPTADPSLLDDELNLRMTTVQQIVRLGHKLRDDAKLRVRQPLAELRYAWPADSKTANSKTANSETADSEKAASTNAASSKAAAVESLADVIKEELNVKSLSHHDDLEAMVTYSVMPNLKTIGAKFGKLTGAVRQAVSKLDTPQLDAFRRGDSVELNINGECIELAAEDVIIKPKSEDGWAFGEEAGLQAALATTLTPELEREGMARDLVRHIQQMRKDEDLEIEDRIVVQLAGDHADISRAIAEWNDYICRETLADQLALGDAPEGSKSVRIGPGKVQISVQRVDSAATG